MDWSGDEELVDARLLDELLAAARRGDPITCGMCGTLVDPADTAEALIPSTLVRFDGIAEPFESSWIGSTGSARAAPRSAGRLTRAAERTAPCYGQPLTIAPDVFSAIPGTWTADRRGGLRWCKRAGRARSHRHRAAAGPARSTSLLLEPAISRGRPASPQTAVFTESSAPNSR